MSGLTISGLDVPRGDRPVLRGLSIDIPLGEITTLLGPNGAGKSTLVLTIGGMLKATAGSVRLDELELAGARPDRIRAAGVAVVPIPGIDWITDVAVLLKLIPDINREFGLSPEQVERLAPDRRLVVYKAITAGGGMLIGRIVTRDLVLQMLKLVGVRLTTQQAAKFVPVAGQAVSAMLTYSALRYVCEQHIQQCREVARQLALPAP